MYYTQTNGQSEWSNQTTKIALRHQLPDLDSESHWPKALPRLQALINNLRNINLTELSPNKSIYSFWTKEAIDLLPHNKQAADKPANLDAYQPLQVNAKDAIAFAQM